MEKLETYQQGQSQIFDLFEQF